MVIFFIFRPTSNQLVVDEDDKGKFRLERVERGLKKRLKTCGEP